MMDQPYLDEESVVSNDHAKPSGRKRLKWYSLYLQKHTADEPNIPNVSSTTMHPLSYKKHKSNRATAV